MLFDTVRLVAVPAIFFQLVCMLAGTAGAVNLTYYRPAPGVSPEFGNFLLQFYTQAEATTQESTTKFVAYFANNATIVLGGQTLFSGKSGAGVFKSAITGGNSFNHYPKTPSVKQTTPYNMTLALAGAAKETYPNGTCVSNDYVTEWTVIASCGKPVLAPEASEILLLNLVSQTPSAGGCNSY